MVFDVLWWLKLLPETGAHHEEGVTNPQAAPAHGTLRDAGVLTVNGDGDRRRLAHGAAAYVRFDLGFFHGHHGERRGGRQPVGLVVPAGVVTNVSRVAVQEGHGAEAWEARARQTWRMREKTFEDFMLLFFIIISIIISFISAKSNRDIRSLLGWVLFPVIPTRGQRFLFLKMFWKVQLPVSKRLSKKPLIKSGGIDSFRIVHHFYNSKLFWLLLE